MQARGDAWAACCCWAGRSPHCSLQRHAAADLRPQHKDESHWALYRLKAQHCGGTVFQDRLAVPLHEAFYRLVIVPHPGMSYADAHLHKEGIHKCAELWLHKAAG